MSLATPPLPTTIESLPDEVLCRIMELARLDWPAGRASLFAASLVCRLWRDAAQRALFTHVELLGRSSLLLSSQALGRYNPVSLTIKDGPGHAFGVEVKAVLERCRGIRSLSLEKAEVVGLEWSVLLLPALADLSSLSLFYPERLLDPFIPTSPTPLPFRLSRLFLWLDLSLPTAPSPDLLSALLASSIHSIDELHLRIGVAGTGSLGSLLPETLATPLAARLRSLILEFDGWDSDGVPSLVGQCLSLEHLDITVDSEVEGPLDFLLDVLRALPPSAPLSHLVLRVSQGLLQLSSPPYDFIDALFSPALASLRRLDFPDFDFDTQALEWEFGVEHAEGLMEGCGKRNISVHFSGELL